MKLSYDQVMLLIMESALERTLEHRIRCERRVKQAQDELDITLDSAYTQRDKIEELRKKILTSVNT